MSKINLKIWKSQQNTIKGVCLFYNYTSKDLQKVTEVVHISCLRENYFGLFLNKIRDTFKNEKASQIIISLIHKQAEDNKFILNKNLQKIIKGQKFRWKFIKNKETQRMTVYELKFEEQARAVRHPLQVNFDLFRDPQRSTPQNLNLELVQKLWANQFQ